METNEPKNDAVAVVTPQYRADSLYQLIMRASTDANCDPAKLRELLAVRREWNADEAAAAFNAAMVQFQRDCPIIAKLDTADGKKYARMDRIWSSIKPLVDKCGLSITWSSARIEGEFVKLDGFIRHIRGHSEPIHYELPMPEAIKTRDGKAVQNAAQVMGVAMTYAKRQGTCAVLGIVTGDDTDGTCGQPAIPEHVAHLRALCVRAGVSEAQLVKAHSNGGTRLEDIPDAAYPAARGQLERKIAAASAEAAKAKDAGK